MNNHPPSDEGLAIAIGFVIAGFICVLAASKVPSPGNYFFGVLAAIFGIIGAFGAVIEVSRSNKDD